MRTNDVVRMTGETRRTLQHYEKLGLLRPERTGSNYRDYSEEDLRILFNIVSFREVGHSLPEIHELLYGAERSQLQILDQQINELEEARRRIDGQLAAAKILREAIARDAVFVSDLLAFLLLFPEKAWILSVGSEGDERRDMERLAVSIRALSSLIEEIPNSIERMGGEVDLARVPSLFENLGLELEFSNAMPDMPPSLALLGFELLVASYGPLQWDSPEIQEIVTMGREKIAAEAPGRADDLLDRFSNVLSSDSLEVFGALASSKESRRSRLFAALAIAHNLGKIERPPR